MSVVREHLHGQFWDKHTPELYSNLNGHHVSTEHLPNAMGINLPQASFVTSLPRLPNELDVIATRKEELPSRTVKSM